ncbi:serine hydrolase domain-containing protein [Qipengyuania spongiae]|uniref:Beta-lactamase family protein n=1 Tax=Qipengyuania spongiae TaxID=2909673 RepID=A0ABY5SVN3_9SPHN|nr:serine hydrolase [Qipengyuania spongiae]UVI38210.1 beta-lactamase family protein [Qipengyuania spongiae]
MIRHALLAAAALTLLPAATVATAQAVTQDDIEARYDRALAAGYKALFLCGAIANAERNGTTRSPESVERWELTGIQQPLDGLVGSLRAVPIRVSPVSAAGASNASPLVAYSVEWGEGAKPRLAVNSGETGCRLAPIGTDLQTALGKAGTPMRPVRSEAGAAPADPSGIARRGFDQELYGEGTRTTAVLVTQRARSVAEAYDDDFGPNIPQRTWSVAKSLAATLVGAAVERGDADVEASAGLGAEESDPRRAISIDDLLRMTSGRYSDTAGNRTDPLYFGGATVEERATDWPLLNAPGTVFRYANNDTLMAVRAIADGLETHSPAELFARLGMEHTVAETDWEGSYILSSQVWASARDLAKLGQLYLQDGRLSDGTRILPESWVDYVSSPRGPQPNGPFGYGAGFWLMNNSDGVPGDTFAAFGNRGQYVVIVPSREIVIVRRGEDPTGSRFDIAAFTRDVLTALD